VEYVQLAVGVTARETYIRETLSAADAAVTFYRHEDLAREQVLDRLLKHYVAWTLKRARRAPLNSSELSPSVWHFGTFCIPNHCGVSGHFPCLNRRNALNSALCFGAVIAHRWPGGRGIRPRHAHTGRPGWHR
jgi:hypothetical protein